MLVSEAAKKLDMNTQTLRLALQQRLFTSFGCAIKTSERRWTYYINDKRLEDYLNGRDYCKTDDCDGTCYTDSVGDRLYDSV